MASRTEEPSIIAPSAPPAYGKWKYFRNHFHSKVPHPMPKNRALISLLSHLSSKVFPCQISPLWSSRENHKGPLRLKKILKCSPPPKTHLKFFDIVTQKIQFFQFWRWTSTLNVSLARTLSETDNASGNCNFFWKSGIRILVGWWSRKRKFRIWSSEKYL